MSVPEIGFIPQIGAVAMGTDRFDLMSWDGVRAWLNAGQGLPSEHFQIHQDDIAALEAAMKESPHAA